MWIPTVPKACIFFKLCAHHHNNHVPVSSYCRSWRILQLAAFTDSGQRRKPYINVNINRRTSINIIFHIAYKQWISKMKQKLIAPLWWTSCPLTLQIWTTKLIYWSEKIWGRYILASINGVRLRRHGERARRAREMTNQPLQWERVNHIVVETTLPQSKWGTGSMRRKTRNIQTILSLVMA